MVTCGGQQYTCLVAGNWDCMLRKWLSVHADEKMRRLTCIYSVVFMSLRILLLMGVTECYIRQSLFTAKSTKFYGYRRIKNGDFCLSCIDDSDVIPNQSVVASSELNLKVESSSVELSNVNAVRYFINLTNGIEAVGTLLKQGIPIEHIHVRNLLH